jgi:hypothetical protein
MLLPWLSPIVCGQNVVTQNIRGVVADDVSRYPLLGAVVYLPNSQPVISSVTNGNGEFELTDVSIGRHTVVVSFLGYETKQFSNQLVIGGKELYLEVFLSERITQVGEVVVQGQKAKNQPRNDMAMVSARSFTVEEQNDMQVVWAIRHVWLPTMPV